MGALAIHGGKPVHQGSWPAWPQCDSQTVEAVSAALHSGRWTLSGAWNGFDTYEREFARRFADFVRVPFCVSTDHGASSLMLALEALGVGAGDEVVVPVLTWVGTATAVLNVNALPVFADIDPNTGCLAPEAALSAITGRTRAIIAVHLNCRMVDMDALLAVARRSGVPVVEDCAQAHGARWNECMAGSLGAVGAFSMQQGKVLTAGEGGAVVTSDARLYERLQQLRSDGRRYSDQEPAHGEPYLVEIGEVMGGNFALSEIQAALLLDQLGRIGPQIDRRAAAAALLDEELGALPGLSPLYRSPSLKRPSVFRYAVRREPSAFGARPTAAVCAALSAELGVRVNQTDRPLHRNVLYCPQTKERHRWIWDRLQSDSSQTFPHAERMFEQLILVPHNVLLSDSDDLTDVVKAFEKVQRHFHEL